MSLLASVRGYKRDSAAVPRESESESHTEQATKLVSQVRAVSKQVQGAGFTVIQW